MNEFAINKQQNDIKIHKRKKKQQKSYKEKLQKKLKHENQ